MYQALPLTMILEGIDEKTQQPAKSTRPITVNVAQLAYFHETPDGPETLVQMDGGQRFMVRERAGAVNLAIPHVGGRALSKLTMATERLPVYLIPSKVNFVVPNPDGSTSIQIGGGAVLHVSESPEQVHGIFRAA